ncbi:hypothetical protein EIP86_010623 [Pleurotus ostreatoroseus]|nr:hypothetical protein EIP86_010623 [Pleurotus ostreatoroseus]
MYLPELPRHRPQAPGPVVPYGIDASRGKSANVAAVPGTVPSFPVPETLNNFLTLVTLTLSSEFLDDVNAMGTATPHEPTQTSHVLPDDAYSCMPVDEAQPFSTPTPQPVSTSPGIYIDPPAASPALAAGSVVLFFCNIFLVYLFCKIWCHRVIKRNKNPVSVTHTVTAPDTHAEHANGAPSFG